jgi:hypothetical protein
MNAGNDEHDGPGFDQDRLVREPLGWRGTSTRAELGRLTGLSRSAVAQIVASLIEDGAVIEAPAELAGPGIASGRPTGCCR